MRFEPAARKNQYANGRSTSWRTGQQHSFLHEKPRIIPHDKERFLLIVFFLMSLVAILIWRMADLTIFDRGFLEKQGNARSLRSMSIPAYRGMIMDRHGAPLAVSTPVDAVWVNPRETQLDNPRIPKLAEYLGVSLDEVKTKMGAKPREFVYLKRGLDPMVAENIRLLNIPGIHLQREFKRYYPDGEVTAQLVGFTNIDDQGQEGLELAYNTWLKGAPGQERVIKDRLGHIIENVQRVQEPKPGKNLMLSIDRSIQYAAYRELKKAVAKLKASSGSAVVLDARTGEILAMVNQPSYNPNNRAEISPARIRNRALTDTFEPGSVMKAFSVASALNSGKYEPDSLIDTGRGWMTVVGRRTPITDEHPGGLMTVTSVLQKSSNVGVTKMMLTLPSDQLSLLLQRAGFGQSTNTGFPGESAGVLPIEKNLSPSALATLAFGYGLSVTTTQLARGYTIFANHGKVVPVSLLPVRTPPQGETVMNEKAADEMLTMLEAVVEGGSGKLAKVKGYRVAGKTGTSRMVGHSGYIADRHIATFAGIAPVTDPRFVVIITVEDPKLGGLSYYAATAAAPVFSRIMGATLRILDIPFDNNVSPEAVKENSHP